MESGERELEGRRCTTGRQLLVDIVRLSDSELSWLRGSTGAVGGKQEKVARNGDLQVST